MEYSVPALGSIAVALAEQEIQLFVTAPRFGLGAK